MYSGKIAVPPGGGGIVAYLKMLYFTYSMLFSAAIMISR
jgi:hypothetical protein